MPRRDPLKYYIYVSDSKVEMLYAQIPRSILQKIVTETTISVKFLTATLKANQREDLRYWKLAKVVNYLRKYSDVGTVNEPKDYFVGTLPLLWGPISDDIVYFGNYNKQTVLGLGGSLHHVIGGLGDFWTEEQAKPRKTIRFASRNLGALLDTQELILNRKEVLNWSFQEVEADPPPSGYPSRPEDRDALETVANFSRSMRGPRQRVEFLAKRLLEGPVLDHPHVLLGTPVYVALAENNSVVGAK